MLSRQNIITLWYNNLGDSMNLNIIEDKNKIIIETTKDFEPKHIFECGQAFRWTVQEDNSYTTVAFNRVINVKKQDDKIIFSNTNREEFLNIWYEYFDLGRDYGEIKRTLSMDPIMKDATKYGNGIRILNQEPFETIISFIISANNQIPRIKRSIELISQHYGEKIPLYHGGSSQGSYYGFPTPEQLAAVDLEELKDISRVGFRAERIIKTSQIISNGEINLDSIYKLDRNKGKELLMTLPGVGPKVSDCILLFAFNKEDAFPVDVWVKRVMEYFYLKKDTNIKHIGEEGSRIFGKLAGFAQQYLFYYAREEGIGK